MEGNERTVQAGFCFWQSLDGTVCLSLATVRGGIYFHSVAAVNLSWWRLITCANSRKIWPTYHETPSQEIMCQTSAIAYKIAVVRSGARTMPPVKRLADHVAISIVEAVLCLMLTNCWSSHTIYIQTRQRIPVNYNSHKLAHTKYRQVVAE